MTVPCTPSPLVKALVIDANTLIHGQLSLSSRLKAEEYWTVPEVLSVEVRDAATRLLIAPILDLIQTRSPDAESLRLVTQFAKKTGDLAVLSATDLRLLALTVCLEKERRGSLDHLRKEPSPAKTFHGGNGGPKKDTSTGPEHLSDSIHALTLESQTAEPARTSVIDDADEGWITPTNIKFRQASNGSSSRGSTTDKSLEVACTTTDFAMQNVLLQMGLGLISPEGARITVLKHWILRCHACYQTTPDATKRFCPSCGNATLIRTSTSIDAQTGEVRLYLKRHFQYNNRGSVYSIPKPQGGKVTSSSSARQGDMILREDQKEYLRGMKSYERSQRKANADPDALPFYLMSASVREHASQNYSMAPPVIGHGRKNPNQVKRTNK